MVVIGFFYDDDVVFRLKSKAFEGGVLTLLLDTLVGDDEDGIREERLRRRKLSVINPDLGRVKFWECLIVSEDILQRNANTS